MFVSWEQWKNLTEKVMLRRLMSLRGIRVLIRLVLTATNVTSLSMVSKWVYICYVLDYMCCTDSLTWFLRLWILNSVNLSYLLHALNSLLHSSELVIKCLHTDCFLQSNMARSLDSYLMQTTWQRPLTTLYFLQSIRLRCYQGYAFRVIVWLHFS